MSGSNPFRRDRRFAEDATTSSPAREDDKTDASARFPPLTIETRSTRGNTHPKHVQFASPPAPDTPLSYSYPSSSASSPESFRHIGSSTTSQRATPGLKRPTNSDPFRSDDSDKDTESADGALSRYTNTESSIATISGTSGLTESQDEVQGTSGFSAGNYRQLSAAEMSNPVAASSQELGKGKQAMDVDAFTKLLLTGESRKPAPNDDLVPPVLLPQQLNVGDSSSSNADSASVSRQSIFEPIPALSTETPRTSHELEPDDADDERRGLSTTVVQARQKPAVPKSRYGKKLSNTIPPIDPAVAQTGGATDSLSFFPKRLAEIGGTTDMNKPLPAPPSDRTSGPAQAERPESTGISRAAIKRPPTPPLTRRQSQLRGQKPQLSRSDSSKTFEVNELDSPSSTSLPLASPTFKAPPPPPARRTNRTSTYSAISSEQSPSIDETSTESGNKRLAGAATDLETGSTHSIIEPKPSRTPSSASRASVATSSTATTSGPPPPPPPRRMRELSKSSIDSQRPIVTDARRPSTESSRNVSGPSNATDILADLAALQKEVDAMRRNPGGGGTGA